MQSENVPGVPLPREQGRFAEGGGDRALDFHLIPTLQVHQLAASRKAW
jgi:hypothetical protein